MSDSLKQEIIDSLKDPVQNLYISTKHISDLRDMQYPNLTSKQFTEEEILVIATRYNYKLPARELVKIGEHSIFRIAGVEKRYIVGNLDIVESILKRECFGMQLMELTYI